MLSCFLLFSVTSFIELETFKKTIHKVIPTKHSHINKTKL